MIKSSDGTIRILGPETFEGEMSVYYDDDGKTYLWAVDGAHLRNGLPASGPIAYEVTANGRARDVVVRVPARVIAKAIDLAHLDHKTPVEAVAIDPIDQLRIDLAQARALANVRALEIQRLEARQQELLVTIRKLSAEVPYSEESRLASVLIAEVGTLKAKLTRVTAERDEAIAHIRTRAMLKGKNP